MSSAQALLALSSLFFSPCKMVQLVTSVSLFMCGWATMVNLYSIFNSSHIFLNFLPSNYFPLSVNKILGKPKWQIINILLGKILSFLLRNSGQLVLTHLIKQYTLTIIFFYSNSNGKHPRMSIPYWRKDHRELNVLSSKLGA